MLASDSQKTHRVVSALSEAAAEFYLLCAARIHIGDRLCQLGTHHKILPQEKRKSEEEGAWYREKKTKRKRYLTGRALGSGYQHPRVNPFPQQN